VAFATSRRDAFIDVGRFQNIGDGPYSNRTAKANLSGELQKVDSIPRSIPF